MNERIEPIVLRGRVVSPTEVIDDGVVVLRAGVIAWVGEAPRRGRLVGRTFRVLPRRR